LPCVDYALLDASAHSDEALLTTFSEKLAVIEHQNAWAFPTLPARLPAANAPFTFGSMTPVNLVSLNTWNTWAEILREAPATRLQLNASEAGNEARQRVFRLLADKGVDASRISWVSATEAGDICAAWQDINLGLCPLAGDSGYDMLLGAWSGVPSLALGSGTPWTRVASGLLALLDQRSFIAPDTAAYVSLAIAQSRDRNALQAQGMALRARLQESAIVDTAGFASAFGMTLEHLWREAGGSLGSEA
jgi:predicted O-linked N-acetylglucosamine transferase (SPINDLY family)